MNYYDVDNRRSKRAATVAVAVYVVLCVLLAWCVRFQLHQESYAEGIMIDFGDGDRGTGNTDMELSELAFEQESAPQPDARQQEMMTAQDEEAPVIEQRREPKKTEAAAQERPAEPVQAPVATPKPREVNRRALFPGRTAQSTAPSEGETNGTGNQGNLAGAANASHAGTGTGTSGVAFDLSGRQPIGELPKPGYTADDQGRVVVQITVNGSGVVTGASYRSVGSTTQNGQLVAEALKAARKARFTPAEGVEVQTGTITYIFKMR